jgi:predicted nucleic acid-binding protein
MAVVADSSPLRYLIVLGEQDLLPELLGEIWIPPAVLEELSASANED